MGVRLIYIAAFIIAGVVMLSLGIYKEGKVKHRISLYALRGIGGGAIIGSIVCLLITAIQLM